MTSLLIGAAPTAPDSWWDDILLMSPRQVGTYQMYFNPDLKYALEYTGSTWIRCYFTLYQWTGTSWVGVPGMSGSLDKGEILVETSTRPELHCYSGEEWLWLGVKAPSLIYPKVRIPNRGGAGGRPSAG